MSIHPLLSLLSYSVLLAAGQALFKLASQQKTTATSDLGALQYAVHLFSMPIFLVACLLYALSTILWVALLKRYPLTQAYPLVIAVSILLTTAIGLLAFNEQLSFDKIMGLVLVTAGVILLSRSLA